MSLRTVFVHSVRSNSVKPLPFINHQARFNSSRRRILEAPYSKFPYFYYAFSIGLAGYGVYTLRSSVYADTGVSFKKEDKSIAHPVDGAVISGNEGGISIQELRKHNRRESVWVAVDGDVWDVTDFVQYHPGGSAILIQHSGTDVTRLFKSIHPPNTIEKNLTPEQKVGRLSDEAISEFKNARGAEDERIVKARKSLYGVDSVTSLSDFEKYAKDLLYTAAWYYFSTGADGEHSLWNNSDTYNRVYFRPRVMRDVSKVDMSTTILGVPSSIPIYVSPTARNGLGQPMGEVAVTRGAGEAGILQVVSQYASRGLQEIMPETKTDQKVGWQIYMNPDREQSAKAIKEAVQLGAHSIWITLDTAILGKRERERRAGAEARPTPNGTPLTRGPAPKHGTHDGGVTWNDIAWVKSLAPGLPIVLKGIGAWEDAVLAQQNGVDAVVLSNHGGRQLDYANAPLKTLYDLRQNSPETLDRKDFEVYIDGGVRRGTDILKALCLGAKGVGLGRPFIYAATGWGSEGVEKAVMILQEELEIGMKLLGVTKLDQLNPQYLDCSKL